MSQEVAERYTPHPMAANASTTVGGTGLGGFLAVTSGTLTVTDANGTVLVNAVPVTAGVYTPMPLRSRTSQGYVVQLAGGASGTLFK